MKIVMQHFSRVAAEKASIMIAGLPVDT